MNFYKISYKHQIGNVKRYRVLYVRTEKDLSDIDNVTKIGIVGSACSDITATDIPFDEFKNRFTNTRYFVAYDGIDAKYFASVDEASPYHKNLVDNGLFHEIFDLTDGRYDFVECAGDEFSRLVVLHRTPYLEKES